MQRCGIVIWLLCVNAIVSCGDQDKPFVVSISKGGGFTSLVQGCELRSDGMIIEWKQYAMGKREELGRKQVSSLRIRELAERLLALESSGGVFGKPGNMTYKIAYTDVSDTLGWSWSIDDSVDLELVEWYRNTREFCIDRTK